MKLELQERDGGVVLRVQAVPGSRRNAVLGIRNGALRVAVTQVAEKGKANKALIEVLAKQLGLRKSQIANYLDVWRDIAPKAILCRFNNGFGIARANRSTT